MQDGFVSGAHAAATRSNRNRCFTGSPIDALVRLDTLTGLRITVLPQGRPRCRGYARWLGICPEGHGYLPFIGTVRDEGHDAHLATTQWGQLRENLMDAGNHKSPQVVGRALGWCGVGRGGDCVARQCQCQLVERTSQGPCWSIRCAAVCTMR